MTTLKNAQTHQQGPAECQDPSSLVPPQVGESVADVFTANGIQNVFAGADNLAPLYHKYPGQTTPQGAFVEFDPEHRMVDAAWNAEIGNAIPFGVYHQQCLRFGVSNQLTGAETQELLESITPLLARIAAGYEEKWDGSNMVGTYSPDAADAIAEVERLCSETEGSALVYQVDEWFQNSSIQDLVRADEPVDVAAVRLEAEANAEGVVLDGDVEEYLADRRAHAAEQAHRSDS